jgi:hypothetical protein
MLLLRNRQFVEQPTVAQRGHGARLLDDLAKLLRAQQRHRRHRDQPGLHHREPRERHRHRVAAAQQHAVAGHEPEVFGQHLRDAVDLDRRLVVRERAAGERSIGLSPKPFASALSSSSSTRFSWSGNCSSGRS